jgi:transposase InsO family protein
MSIVAQDIRYLPHDVKTKLGALNLLSKGYKASTVCRKYHISKASLSRWKRLYDGTAESLIPKSHRPHSPHPNSHTDIEIYWITNYMRRNPYISVFELYGKLRTNRGYTRHPLSLYRVMKRLGYFKKTKPKKKPYIPKHYDTPTHLGVKWQLDVKFVPKSCAATSILPDIKFYQYTIIEEASRERFIYHYDELSSYNSVDFVVRAFNYFGYHPITIQTDNGFEFTHNTKTDKIHPLTLFLRNNGIYHQLIRPFTPRHNGKVERSHRNDNQRFYSTLTFYSLDDLRIQAKRYLNRSNNIPMSVLNYLSPIQKRNELLSLSIPFHIID